MKMNIVFTLPGQGGSYESDARPVATFYAGLLGMRFLREDWYIIAESRETEPHLAFGDGPGLKEMPRWPDPAYPQQIHFDLWPDDQQAAEQRILQLGATPLPAMGGRAPVYADPVGHPFCLCGEGQ